MLARLKALADPIRIAIIGFGAMGKGLFDQCQRTPGMRCVAVAELDIDRASAFLQAQGYPYRVVDSRAAAQEAIGHGQVALCSDGDILCRLDAVSVVIEASSAITAAGRCAVTALEHGKHLVLMNAEIDLTFGPYLVQLARTNGVVCTSCDGDQHGVLKHLVDDIQLWGFELVMAGNIKGFLDRRANLTTIIPEADKRNLSYPMCAAMTDGTKLNIEMALVANALGLATDVPGMHGPAARDVTEVPELFDLEGLRQRRGAVVDYILGANPGGGVFVVGHCDRPYLRDMMAYYKMGAGPFYLFYRPYHLCHVEAMRCIAEAVLDGQALLEPAWGFRTNVIAHAKKDLRQGDKLDGAGGHACYGLIENCADDGANEGLPICLADDVTLTRDVARDERIRLSDIRHQPGRFDFELYRRAAAAVTSTGASRG